MKTSTMTDSKMIPQNLNLQAMIPKKIDPKDIDEKEIELINRLVGQIPWPARRSAMGDVVVSRLDGNPRTAENLLGWNRKTTALGINEFRTKIICVNDISNRRKPRSEEKNPELLADILKIVEPGNPDGLRLKPTPLYTNMTASMVYKKLLKKGWTEKSLPTLRTISNILNRQGYKLRTRLKIKTAQRSKVDSSFKNVYKMRVQA